MKGGELTDFLDRVYYGEELIFLYKDKKYFLQGWWSDDGKTVEMELCIINENLEMIWHQKAMKMAVCAERFLSEKLWDGKDFLQAQEDMTWSDW